MSTLDTARMQRVATALDANNAAIRAKGVTVPAGTKLDEQAALIAQIATGAGGYELLGSGVYTKTDYASVPNKVEIPWTLPSGKAIYAILVYADEPIEGVGQTFRWKRMYNFAPEMQAPFSAGAGIFQYKTATGVPVVQGGNAGYAYYENGHIIAEQRDNNYHVQNNTYNWFVWGGPAE